MVSGLLVDAIFGVGALGSSSSAASARETTVAMTLNAAAAPAKPAAGAHDQWWAKHGAAYGGNFAKQKKRRGDVGEDCGRA